MSKRYVLRGRKSSCALLAMALATLVVACGEPEDVVYNTTLIVESSPENGANVWVAGELRGQTPVTVTGLAPESIVYVRAKKDGYQGVGQEVTVAPEGETQRVLLEMEPYTGVANFESTPSGAAVYLNGEYVGDTPLLNRTLKVGEQTYEMRLDKFLPLRRTVVVEPDFRYTYTHELKPQQGEIEVFSTPSNARVWLNDHEQTQRTPAKFALEPGAYIVAVHAEGYIQKEQMVKLQSATKETVDLKLAPGNAPRDMVLVPAGEFTIGVDGASPDERPQRKVHVNSFYIDRFEVTNEQYKAVFPSHSFDEKTARCPVTNVTFKQASAYALAVGKRLPTEVEWEKAARGPDGWEYPWCPKFEKDLCNSAETFGAKLMPVGHYRAGASPYGCLDMAGNAYEWTQSWYQAYPGNKDVVKEYGQIFRVLRGGSYRTTAFDVRCARRYYDLADSTRPDYGFRCVKDVVEKDSGLQPDESHKPTVAVSNQLPK